MADDNIPIRRRNFLMGAGTAVAASLAPPVTAEAQAAQSAASAPTDAEPLLTLTPTEHAFFVAAADTLIPADDLSPSGSQCGVATFIDRQLAGAYG
ncbi:MAG: gluconate 2-dehydrogenase subunit 3 family protein, partial [Xanthobacteraceae bacterium]